MRFWRYIRRHLIISTVAAAGFVGSILIVININSTIIGEQNLFYRLWAKDFDIKLPNQETLQFQLRQQADTYINAIQTEFLLEGMIVNRDITGEALDVCDSLLFTSIYYVSLKKLGYEKLASDVWQAIESSNAEGQWYRHPHCKKPTSRDMMVGLLLAFSQQPPRAAEHIKRTIKHINNNDGYFSNGSIDVSYLAPGVAEFFRVYAQAYKIDSEETTRLPISFATSEYSTLIVNPGFQTHLVALQVWLEMELLQKPFFSGNSHIRHTISLVDGMPNFMGDQKSLSDYRLSWIAQTIYEQDPDNMFLKYLRLKTAGALGAQAKKLMMAELLGMPQFPKKRPPENCDRLADYLWQRDSHEYFDKQLACTKAFHGVDFLWMTSLLLDESSAETKASAFSH